MHETAPTPPKELEVKLELAPASLPALKKIPLLRTLKVAPKIRGKQRGGDNDRA
jgi:hypothetical protein